MQVAPDAEAELPKSLSPNPHNQTLATKSPPPSPQVGVPHQPTRVHETSFKHQARKANTRPGCTPCSK